MRRHKKQKGGKFFRVNHFIQAEKVRVIDESGKQIGILPLSEALSRARQEELDLVEIASKAKPPVCKIIDFKKFKYLEAKKTKKAKKTKQGETKEIRLSLFIAENDLETRLKRAKKFLKEKNQVRFSVVFKGRQIAKKEFGYELAGKVIKKLTDFGQISQEPKIIGRRLLMVLGPYEKKKESQTEDKKVGSEKV